MHREYFSQLKNELPETDLKNPRVMDIANIISVCKEQASDSTWSHNGKGINKEYLLSSVDSVMS